MGVGAEDARSVDTDEFRLIAYPPHFADPTSRRRWASDRPADDAGRRRARRGGEPGPRRRSNFLGLGDATRPADLERCCWPGRRAHRDRSRCWPSTCARGPPDLDVPADLELRRVRRPRRPARASTGIEVAVFGGEHQSDEALAATWPASRERTTALLALPRRRRRRHAPATSSPATCCGSGVARACPRHGTPASTGRCSTTGSGPGAAPAAGWRWSRDASRPRRRCSAERASQSTARSGPTASRAADVDLLAEVWTGPRHSSRSPSRVRARHRRGRAAPRPAARRPGPGCGSASRGPRGRPRARRGARGPAAAGRSGCTPTPRASPSPAASRAVPASSRCSRPATWRRRCSASVAALLLGARAQRRAALAAAARAGRRCCCGCATSTGFLVLVLGGAGVLALTWYGGGHAAVGGGVPPHLAAAARRAAPAARAPRRRSGGAGVRPIPTSSPGSPTCPRWSGCCCSCSRTSPAWWSE